jgi:hypothetical protein
MLVSDNNPLNNGFVMPRSMNIDEYYIFFLDIVDSDIIFFLEIFPDNEGVNMVSHLMVFLHSTHPFHLSFFQRKWNSLSSLLGI